jgi:hypothetical protein
LSKSLSKTKGINTFHSYYVELVTITWRTGVLAVITIRCIMQEELKPDREEDFGQYMSVEDVDIELSADLLAEGDVFVISAC